MYTKGDWRFEKSDLTIRSNDFKNGSQMGDYKGVIIADLKPALGCDYSDNVDLEHTGRNHAVPQTLANAQLIASAPDLYEALMAIMPELQEYVKDLGGCDHSVGICMCGLNNKLDLIEQALAKAEKLDKTD